MNSKWPCRPRNSRIHTMIPLVTCEFRAFSSNDHIVYSIHCVVLFCSCSRLFPVKTNSKFRFNRVFCYIAVDRLAGGQEREENWMRTRLNTQTHAHIHGARSVKPMWRTMIYTHTMWILILNRGADSMRIHVIPSGGPLRGGTHSFWIVFNFGCSFRFSSFLVCFRAQSSFSIIIILKKKQYTGIVNTSFFCKFFIEFRKMWVLFVWKSIKFTKLRIKICGKQRCAVVKKVMENRIGECYSVREPG